ncbi:MAG: hypothetical protein CSB46_01745 [Micrococcales bacterium]|nr:MAG: hypothetical protein CSB46_01745 [Micrococcales bacterium]
MSAVVFWILFGALVLGGLGALIALVLAVVRAAKESKAAAAAARPRAQAVPGSAQNEDLFRAAVEASPAVVVKNTGVTDSGGSGSARTSPDPGRGASGPAQNASA